MTDEERYDLVCKDKFDALAEGQEKMRKDIGIIREKIFNGLSGRMELNTKLVILILTVLVIDVGAQIVLRFL